MSTRRATARLSALEVLVSFDRTPRAAATFGGVWAASGSVRYVPAERTMKVAVRPLAAGGFEIATDGAPDRVVDDERSVCPLIELAAYDAFLATELAARRTVLHASAVRSARCCYVFAGFSGAGKSALARAASRAGFSHFGDEHVITDGHALWGVPRAIHLDLEPADRPPAPWHTGAERDLYVFRGADGTLLRLPYVPLAPAQLAQHPAPLADVVLVALSRGDRDRVEPLRASERLQLLEGAHFVRSAALAQLALVPQAYHLTWSDPDSALAALEAAVARSSRGE